MKSLYYRVCFMVLFSLFIGGAVSASTPKAARSLAGSTINGMVFDPEKRGLMDVDVELQDEFSRYLARTKTMSGGRFTFTNLTAGVYRVRVIGGRFGYSEQSQQVEIVNFSRGTAGLSNDTVYLDFYLQPLKNTSFAEAVGITGTIFAQEIPDNARNLYNQALADFSQKRTDEGINNLKKALEIFPTYFYALNRLGDELLRKQDFKAAQEVLLKAVAVNPKAADSLYMLGYAQYMQKQFEPAVDSLRQAVNRSQRSAAAFLLLGMGLRQIKKYGEAETELRRADELSKKKSPDVHWQLALLYGNNLKKYAAAADELELFLKTQPDSRDAESIKKLIQKFREKARESSATVPQ
ncbi:MAG: carboxypeptidase regulatory-like domain-containing protein [Acidobacteria bacterium]|nr:carboxypeptidase regulatory-like domain-containing protein [Acidobacteriota bacterium]